MKKAIAILVILVLVAIGGYSSYRAFNYRTSIRNIAVDAAMEQIGIMSETVHDIEIDSEKYGDKQCYEVSFECMDSNAKQIEVEVIVEKKTDLVLSVKSDND